jgi:peptidoglycan biosynthesis protein MviN/MurJ (putative lipid II flippase)
MTVIIILVSMISSLLWLFVLNGRGVAAAIILGLNMIAADYLWQWLRIRFSKSSSKSILLMILGGMVVRLISAIVFLKLAAFWLTLYSVDFYIFLSFFGAIPLLSLLEARKFKLETEKEHGSQPQ